MNVTVSGYCGQCGCGVTMLNYGPLKQVPPRDFIFVGYCAGCGAPLTLRRLHHGESPKDE